MNDPASAVASAAVPRPPLGELELVLLVAAAFLAAGFFSILRSALLHSVPARVLEGARDDAHRARLRPCLDRAEALATSASMLAITFQIVFVALLLTLLGEESLGWRTLLGALAISVPLLVFAEEYVPGALRGERSDRLLRSVLVPFDRLQRPVAISIVALEWIRRAMMRLLRIPEKPRSARRIVEDLRDVIEDSDREGDLREAEREIIENVVDLSDVDVAELMTPRTELTAVAVEDGVAAVVRAIAESGHSRIPVFDSGLDNIVGVAYAHDVLQLFSRGELDGADLRQLLRPVGFVPETKLVNELLAQFRHNRQKMVIVLDEYGGTAGVVTLGDILAELVGEMREEIGEGSPAPIRRTEDGCWDIDASIHVSDVNEELDVGLPEEEDYETLAGFVLAQLGRFPKNGESFDWDGYEFRVTRASDRRVLGVRLRHVAAESA